jgi:hypothetical protein
VGCGLLALFVTGEIWDWQLAVMGMLARRGDSTRTFLALTGIEVAALLAGVVLYAISALKTHRMRQWGVWGEPELEQSKEASAGTACPQRVLLFALSVHRLHGQLSSPQNWLECCL